LIEGEYKITVLARKVVGGEPGEQGVFIQDFAVDVTPPWIITVDYPDPAPNLPVPIFIQTNELATCRYSFYDVNYAEMEYEADTPGFSIDHMFHVFDMDELEETIFVKCIDLASNEMIDPEVLVLHVETLLYPPPGIIMPDELVVSTPQSTYVVVGSTFDSLNPGDWVPGIDLVIARSSFFYDPYTEFEDKFTTKSLEHDDSFVLPALEGFIIELHNNAIIIKDEAGVLQAGQYVEFPSNHKEDFTYYEIKSVMLLSGSYGPDM